MTRASVASALVALTLPLLSLRAADDGPGQAKTAPAHPELTAESKKTDVPSVSRDKLKEILREALKQIQSMD